ncbi:hypothetical protein [Paludisphaera mucosa]|uniref:Uncharacterized protein n=1 Tax=Paludisphaera mucosa TaxID=3030827 RepID=A0ABT6FFS1_9BACT|nr:hypothetical protein [Paludisphaera mucosa]MDG3006426.1 hypothetical protein [Paludisphaera mucosa]
MAAKTVPGKHDRKILWGISIAGFVLWVVLAFMPKIALNCFWFQLDKEEEVKRVESVLSQLGTFGDMFGALNCLFSGAAFVGVVYAVLLQRRELHDSQQATQRAERALGLQHRLSLYQNMADHHRHQEEQAVRDPLLRARSRGRERAFAELMSGLLRESEAFIRGDEPTAEQAPVYYDHPARIGHLAYLYREERGTLLDPQEPFGPVQELLLDLAEELAALTELVRDNPAAQAGLLEAGHAVNAAVQPQNLLEPETTEEGVRAFQVENADLAFHSAIHAAANLFPAVDVPPRAPEAPPAA